MSTIDKLLQDIRAAQGLAPDPLVDSVQPNILLPSEIESPDIEGMTQGGIDESLAGMAPPQVSPDELISGLTPEPLVAPPAPTDLSLASVGLTAESARTSQSVASGSQAADTLAKYKKYETGTGDQLSAEMGAIDASKNPEAEAATQSAMESDETMAGVVSNQAEMAALAEQQASEEAVIQQQEAGEVQAYQDDIEQSYAEGLNRIDEVDREVADIAAREPDPGRYWSNATAGQKGAYLLIAALQAFAKPNETPKIVELVTKFIDDDVRIQEDRLGRELAAAQGRGRSVRDIIAMGKDKDTAIYGQKMLAVAGLEKALASKMRGLGAGPAAEAQVLAAKQVLDQSKARYREAAAQGARSNAQIEAARLEGARQRAASAQARSDARRWELEDQAREDRKEAAKLAGAETPQVNVEGVEGGVGGGEGIVPNPAISDAGKQLAEVAKGYRVGAETIADGIAIAERIRREGKTPQLDKDWNSWVTRAQPSIARSQGHTGVLTQKDVMASVAGSGYEIIDADGVLSVATLRNMRTKPDDAIKFLQTLDRAATIRMGSTIKALAHPNQPDSVDGKPGWRVTSAQDYRDRGATKEAASAQAAKDDRALTMGGMSRKDPGYEKSYREAAGIIPFASGRTPAELQMGAVVKDGRGDAATGETATALYDAKASLEAALKSAKTPAEKMDLSLRTKRAEAGIYVIESTPKDRTPAQHAKALRAKADSLRSSAERRKAGIGGVPTSAAEISAAEREAVKFEAAIKLATGAPVR